MEENLQNQQNQETPQVQTQINQGSSQKWIKIALFALGGLILITGAFYAGVRYSEKQERQSLTKIPTPTTTPQQPIEFPKPTPVSETGVPKIWRNWRAVGSSVINFEYPNGWHVYSGWFYKEGDPIPILLDPEPLDGAPRGGPGSTIMINDYFGNDNPEEILKKNIEEAKKNVTDLRETSFVIDSTTFYKIEGKTNLFGQTVPVLEYHTLLKGPNTNNINTHVIRAQLTYFGDDEEHKIYVEIFDRIVRSLRHKDQK